MEEITKEVSEPSDTLHAIIVKIGSDKNHRWMLNLGGNFDEKQDMCMLLNVSQRIYQLQGENNNCTVKKSDNTLTGKSKHG